jgi:peptidoglycan/LPS O-acetylase OafA/YrhL
VGAVVAYHVVPGLLPGGFLGVDVFFVISGYLISGLILSDLHGRSFSLSTFYLRRARRILPALLVMFTGVSLLALLILMPDEMARFGASMAASAAFVPNLALLYETGYFDAQAQTKPLLHLWSLGVEEQFYLLWPVLLLLLARLRPGRRLAAIGSIAIASFLLHLWVSEASAAASFYLPFTRFWQLLAGAWLAAAHLYLAWLPRSRAVQGVLSTLGLAMIAGAFVLARPLAGSATFMGVAPTLGATLFIAAGPNAFFNRTVFSFRPVVYLGLISYPLYLWHWPLLSFLRIVDLESESADRLLRIAAVLVALAAAALTYHFVERPLRRRADLRKLGMRLLLMLAAAAIAGAGIHYADGFPGRTRYASDPFVWEGSLRTDPRCLARYVTRRDLDDEMFCVRNDYGSEPTIVLTGDSHANAIWPGVSGEPAPVLHIGASACPYLAGTTFWRDERPAKRELCPLLMGMAHAAITRDTKVVIFAARDTMYTASPAEDAATRGFTTPGHLAAVDSPEADPLEIYERALTRDVSALLGSGKSVVIVLQVPELGFSPRRCVAMRPVDSLLRAPARDACDVPRAAVEARQAAYRRVVARVAQTLANPALYVVDPMEALCDRSVCRAVVDGTLLYRDDHHLNEIGSRYVWSRIRPRSLAVSVEPAPQTAQ